MGSDAAKAQASKILAGLGFTRREMQDCSTKSLVIVVDGPFLSSQLFCCWINPPIIFLVGRVIVPAAEDSSGGCFS